VDCCTQVAAESLSLPIERVKFILGDTRLPRAPVHGGSMTMASVGSAVQAACRKAREDALARGGANDLTEAMRRLGHDPHVNPLGVKGVGEIAMVGVAPAITNAIFHATGMRLNLGGTPRVALKKDPGLLGTRACRVLTRAYKAPSRRLRD
jgi:CO/xanthine dehydrogenase Mo-binding subunit